MIDCFDDADIRSIDLLIKNYNASLDGYVVMVRVDFNVSTNISGNIYDDSRLREPIPTLMKLVAHGAKVVLIAHRGRPKGFQKNLSLRALTKPLSRFLKENVVFIENWHNTEIEKHYFIENENSFFLLENIRFSEDEEKNSKSLCQKLSCLADFYVMEAFSVAHRAHASTCGIASFLPTYYGYSFKKSVCAFSHFLTRPSHPYVALVGGNKISTKIDALEALVNSVDALIVGGAMANTFLLACGYNIGSSLYENSMMQKARNIVDQLQRRGCAFIFPVDAKVVKNSIWQKYISCAPDNCLVEDYWMHTVSIDSLDEDDIILDIGPRTLEKIGNVLRNAQTIVWNGPFGMCEVEPFDHGTHGVAELVKQQSRDRHVLSVVGGGDTLHSLESQKGFSYVSTAGGAFLTWISGKQFPILNITQKTSIK